VPDLGVNLLARFPPSQIGWSVVGGASTPLSAAEQVLSLSAAEQFAALEAQLAGLATRVPAERIDEELRRLIAAQPTTREEVLRAAMESLTKIEAVYTRKFDGSTGTYRLSPYEVGVHPESGRTVLWATVDDGTGAQPEGATHPGMPHDGIIHAFLYDRIGEVKPTAQPFAPLWPVQPESV